MVCPNCIKAATAGAAAGVSVYTYFSLNENKFATPVLHKIGVTGIAILFGATAFLTSAISMTALYKLGVYNYFANNCHSVQQNEGLIFSPFYNNPYSPNDPFFATLKLLSSTPFIEDTPENNLLIAATSGSKIFAKQGLNYIVGGEGPDSFFFSMCSTKTEDGKTSVIANFEDGKDKIYLFCTKNEISAQQLKIQYDVNYQSTLLTIDDPNTGLIALSILGEHHNLLDSVIINEKWIDHISDTL